MFPDYSALTSNQLISIATAVLLCFSFTVWTILDAWKRDFESTNEKVLWIQICIFVPILGSLAYLSLGRKRGRKRT
ncbi:PLD nuclease N-terminal domain-containing protein [Pseudodesulfovibrio piezophilus]|uniref:PLD nuclease N-terminal domain-containing protein n=1 Tax=Pseudodesulfovibrio piezophilus TaxID=879567 RepID=UPI0005A1F384|nr:PLD nuclease N-terminal domain-containing protein [Pseudodesulfovibrio piezophilus]